MRVVAVLVLIARVAAANTSDTGPKGPQWLSGPDRAYNCTHYLGAATGWRQAPKVAVGAEMNLTMPRDKVMTFKLAAKGKGVRFELERAPAGAKLAGATFTWKVAGKPGQMEDFSIVAIGADGGRTPWRLRVIIADDKLFTAWSAGMGSVWPDCDVSAGPNWSVADLDGDGKDDVIYDTFAGDDGSTEKHVMLQRGAMKFTEATSCFSCGFTAEVARDGTRLLIVETDCCCIHTYAVLKLDGDTFTSVDGWQLASCGDQQPGGATVPELLTFDRDDKHRIKGVTISGSRPEHLHWRDGGFTSK